MKKNKIKTPRPENELFREWFNNLPHAQRPGIRKLLCDKCHISNRTVDNWLYDVCGIATIYQEKINELAQETIFQISKGGSDGSNS
jgi:hypothetical protein